jgi:hypothetical protein
MLDNGACRKLVKSLITCGQFEINILMRNKAKSRQKSFYRKKKITVVYIFPCVLCFLPFSSDVSYMFLMFFVCCYVIM